MLKIFNLAKMWIIFIYLTSFCCFFISSQNVLSRDILSQNVSSLNIPLQDTSQDIWYTYEEPIEGLQRYSTYALSEGTLMIWMAFRDEENPSCMLPYFHLRVIERTGQITYIDLNYTFPSETVCPVNMTFKPFNNYIMIIYVKSNNGVKEKYGLIINYYSEIKSEIYLGSANDHIILTEVNYYQLEFLTTGSFVQFGAVPKVISNADNFNLLSLVFEGFLVEKYYKNTTAKNFYILDHNGNYKSGGYFGPEFVHYNMFRRNGTLLGIKEQIGNKLEILLKPLLRLNNHGAEYDNPAIESTKPAVHEFINSSINEITIKYGIPVRLSTANISIYQLNGDLYKPNLLRQTISGDSKLCTIGSDNHTVHIPIFSSTFNQPNTSYHVVIDNNFVISQERNEPLIGTNEKIWIFSTKPFKTERHSESITGLLRLNEEGSSKFLQTNQSEFFNNIIQEFSKIIPVDKQRITTNGKWQNDPTFPKKVLLSFTINEAKSAMEPSSKTIFDNLGTLIERKRFTALSNNEYASFIDESASFTMTSYFGKFLPLIIIFLVSAIILLILYFLAHWKHPEGRNMAIFETALIMQDFAVDLTFTLLRVNNTPHLVIPNMVFLIVPHVVNFSLAINIFLSEVATNPTFYTWFSELPTLLSICTIFTAIDVLAINTLTSNLFGLKVFSAPLSQRSRNIILWGSFINIFAEDIPQLVIQILYFNSVVTYDLIPSLVLISGGLVIINKLILRSYQALIRWYHQHDEIIDFNRNRHLSAGSIRSIRSNV
ncbi:hypothetical protein C1646_753350 [Rhizophagus diaphanus]|nr:hypothetical protein C1646_753350 [Rhizophagus diaphanus] [Rhizophagus sp. MUCL 43196]